MRRHAAQYDLQPIRVSQLASNLKSIDVTLSNDLLKEIDALHDESPNPG